MPEPDNQPSYSPVPQRREWSTDSNHDDINNDNEQLIDDETAEHQHLHQKLHEPYMRASKAVSMDEHCCDSFLIC